MGEWEDRYVAGALPWDTDEPSEQLRRILLEHRIAPGRAVDLGCGTGTHAVYLAGRGFDVLGCDLAPTAVARARERARAAGVGARFVEADLLASPDLGRGFDLAFDRGVYHVLRLEDPQPYLELLGRTLRPGGLYVVLCGNANEPEPHHGPPRVHAHELCAELQPRFDLVELREFRFDGVRVDGRRVEPLGWAGVFRLRAR